MKKRDLNINPLLKLVLDKCRD